MNTSTSYPSRRSARLREYDYSQSGAYFVTICTERRLCRFGSIQDGAMVSNLLGQFIAQTWVGLGERFGIEMDAFVVMPNHLHGIVVLEARGRARQEPAPTGEVVADGDLSLSEVMRRFKTFTANQSQKMGEIDSRFAGVPLWQRNFYERVIRNERELNATREYIASNPLQWLLDRENPDH